MGAEAYFKRGSRMKGLFGAIIGGIFGLALALSASLGLAEATGFGAFASGGGSRGPYRPQPPTLSASEATVATAQTPRPLCSEVLVGKDEGLREPVRTIQIPTSRAKASQTERRLARKHAPSGSLGTEG